MFKLDANDPDNRLDYGELKKANEAGKMPTVDQKIVDEQTSIEIRGCNIGRSPLMLNQLDKAFGGKAKVTAPTHEQHYSHDASGTYHEDFSGYFVEEPGKKTKSDKELQPLFAAKYPFVEREAVAGAAQEEDGVQRPPARLRDRVLMPEPAGAVARLRRDAGRAEAQGRRLELQAHQADADGRRLPVRVRGVAAQRGQAGEADGQARRRPAGHRRSRGDGARGPVRPDAYEYKDVQTAVDPASGNKAFNLFPERTEWRIRHEVIKDAQGPYRPAATDKELLGRVRLRAAAGPAVSGSWRRSPGRNRDESGRRTEGLRFGSDFPPVAALWISFSAGRCMPSACSRCAIHAARFLSCAGPALSQYSLACFSASVMTAFALSSDGEVVRVDPCCVFFGIAAALFRAFWNSFVKPLRWAIQAWVPVPGASIGV